MFLALLILKDTSFFLGVSPCFSAPDEDVRAEFFMEELNNGVKLCKLIGALQAKIAQSCPSDLCQVSRWGGAENMQLPTGAWLWTGTR